MENRLDRIETQLDKINDHLMQYNAQLTIHIEGTVQNREHIKTLEKMVNDIISHVHEVRGIAKFLKFIGAGIALAATIVGMLDIIGVI